MLDPSAFKESRETKIVKELFLAMKTRAPPMVTWAELSEATGKTREQLRGPCATAQRYMLSSHGVVIASDRGVGYRLAAPPEIVDITEKHVDRARRTSRTGLRKAKTVDLQTLTIEQRSRHLVLITVHQLALDASRPRTRDNITQMVVRSNNALTEQEMLNIIRDGLYRKGG